MARWRSRRPTELTTGVVTDRSFTLCKYLSDRCLAWPIRAKAKVGELIPLKKGRVAGASSNRRSCRKDIHTDNRQHSSFPRYL